jgi:hypothetical protein
MVVRLHSDGDPAAEEEKHAQEQCECLSVPTAPSAAVSTHIEVGSKATSYLYTLQGTNTTSEHNKGRTKGPLSSFIGCLSSHQRSIIVRSNFREALIVIMFPLSHTHTHTHTRTHTLLSLCSRCDPFVHFNRGLYFIIEGTLPTQNTVRIFGCQYTPGEISTLLYTVDGVVCTVLDRYCMLCG